ALSDEKTLITHARSQAAKFLRYEVVSLHQNRKRTIRRRTRGRDTKCRSINGHIGLGVPRAVVLDKCKRYMQRGKAVHRTELLQETDYNIIAAYQIEDRGCGSTIACQILSMPWLTRVGSWDGGSLSL